MKSIGDILKQLRIGKDFSIEEVVNKLKDHNIVISAKTLYGYENGNAIRSSTFLALCDIYTVHDIFSVFLGHIPKATFEWPPTHYEDYFNGRTVNEKYDMLVDMGIPSFAGYEQQCTGDVFFGRTSLNRALLLSDFEFEIITKLRLLSVDQQKVFLAYLTTLLNTQSP